LESVAAVKLFVLGITSFQQIQYIENEMARSLVVEGFCAVQYRFERSLDGKSN